MKELTEEQVIKLIEENLNNRFRYYLDSMKEEKRPFGNSGSTAIRRDIQDIIKSDKKWEVADDDELEELMYKFMTNCFDDINEWVDKNRDKFKVKLDAILGTSEGGKE